MTLQPRDHRALSFLAVSAILSGIVYFWPAKSAPVVAATDSATLAEKRLTKLRAEAATVPEKEAILKSVSADLAKREAGLIQADTAAQAQAQVIEILKRLCAAEMPPIEIRATELGGIVPLGDSYGLANVAVDVECRIEELVNLLAAIDTEPKFVSTSDVRITSSNNPKQKTVVARLAIAGVVPRKLVPQKKGARVR